MSSKDIGAQVTMKIPYANVYLPYFHYMYLLTFFSVYIITLLSLRTYIKRTRIVFFYIIFSIPMIYFLLKSLPFFIEYITSLILYSSSIYGTLYSLIFSGTGPLGGILFSLAILVFSRRMDNPAVIINLCARYVIIFYNQSESTVARESSSPVWNNIQIIHWFVMLHDSWDIL